MRIALKMEAHALQSCEAPAGFRRMNRSHAKSEDRTQRGERRKTRFPGRPGEGAVRGFSGATRRSIRLESQLRSPGSRCNQTNGDLRLRAPAPEKRSLCATTRQSRGIKPTNLLKCSDGILVSQIPPRQRMAVFHTSVFVGMKPLIPLDG